VKEKIKRILITGAAGFIGGSVISRLSNNGFMVQGIDSFSTYYNPKIKQHHITSLGIKSKVDELDICDLDALRKVYERFQPQIVIHLAAQGGVRASQTDPAPYIQTNQMGFHNLLVLNSEFSVLDFIYASSSSVYGEGLPSPFHEDMTIPGPKSLYAASKVANELMAEHFPYDSSQHRIGLRFFTVYGPWGRPDMAVSRLLASGYKKRPFVLTANLDLVRDFTYVEDVVDVVEDLVNSDLKSFGHHTLLNVAGDSPRSMDELIGICSNLNIPVKIEIGKVNSLDVATTHGSSSKLRTLGFRIPQTSLEVGVRKTANWMAEKPNQTLIKYLD
jgi:UDP-glucuronate 4-epimerase